MGLNVRSHSACKRLLVFVSSHLYLSGTKLNIQHSCDALRLRTTKQLGVVRNSSAFFGILQLNASFRRYFGGGLHVYECHTEWTMIWVWHGPFSARSNRPHPCIHETSVLCVDVSRTLIKPSQRYSNHSVYRINTVYIRYLFKSIIRSYCRR